VFVDCLHCREFETLEAQRAWLADHDALRGRLREGHLTLWSGAALVV